MQSEIIETQERRMNFLFQAMQDSESSGVISIVKSPEFPNNDSLKGNQMRFFRIKKLSYDEDFPHREAFENAEKQELEDKSKILQNEIDKLTIDIVNKYIKYLKNSKNNEWNKKVIPTLDEIRNTTKVSDSDENMLKAAFLEFMNKLYNDFQNEVITKNIDIINVVFEAMTYEQNSTLFYIPYSKNDKDLALLVKLFETKQKLENVNKEIAALEKN